MNRDSFVQLVIQNLKGSISDIDFEKLNGLSAENVEYAKLRFELEEAWDASGEISEIVAVSELKKVKIEVNKKLSKPIQIIFNYKWLTGIAALLILGFFYLFSIQNSSVEYRAENENRVITLVDGSQVNLRKGSLLQVADFKENRTLELQGEAYFDVTKSTQPFIVNLKDLSVQVLGTSFLVKESKVHTSIVLDEGSVRIESKINGDTVVINPRETIRHLPNGKLIKIQGINNLASWKSGVLRYNAIRLDSVVNELEEIFAVEIEIANQEIKDCMLSGILTGNSLSALLDQISERYAMNITKSGDKYELTDGICK